jgi:SpoVK/Ycf46/Vps4 family AAA+-type ATPase
LWIDELEKAMPGGTGESQDGGLSKRLFGAFLTWLQEKQQPVFVVATANDLFNTPPELLRKGRFDEIFFVDLPTDAERHSIFGIHLELRKQSPAQFDIDRLVAATEGFSGAEIEQAVIASLYRAIYQKKPLDTELLLVELEETVPLSVSRAEDITRLRETAKGRFVNVN